MYAFNQLVRLVAPYSAENQLDADNDNDSRSGDFPKHIEVQHILTAKKQEHADSNSDNIAELFALVEKSD